MLHYWLCFQFYPHKIATILPLILQTTPPYPACLGFPLEAPSKFSWKDPSWGGFHWVSLLDETIFTYLQPIKGRMEFTHHSWRILLSSSLTYTSLSPHRINFNVSPILIAISTIPSPLSCSSPRILSYSSLSNLPTRGILGIFPKYDLESDF